MKLVNKSDIYIRYIWRAVALFVLPCGFASCSSTSNIPEGEQLYAGLEKIRYENYEKSDQLVSTQEEVEAALAIPPNGALLGSSYYRTPFPVTLWIWNAFADSESGVGKWIGKTFGKRPVLISKVNPQLRASVAQTVLKNRGYFQGRVEHDLLTLSNKKKAKIAYTLNFGPLYRLDSIRYLNFPRPTLPLLDSTQHEAKIKRGTPFDVAILDAERRRLSKLLREKGYFYYQPDYASYVADTFSVPGKVQLRMQVAKNIPDRAKHPWYIGKVDLLLRKQLMEQLNDSVKRRRFTIRFNGRRPPLRARTIFREMKLRPGRLYNHAEYEASYNKITDMGLFSMVDFQFTPRDSSIHCDTLDLTMNCVLDKRYDFYVESNFTGKTNGRLGPGIVVGLTKRNAFRGGEKLDLRVNGSYEWQTSYGGNASASQIHSYEYGASGSIEFPNFISPFWRKHRFYTSPTTLLSASTNVINRAGYFKRHVVSGEWTYHFQTSENSFHQFSPLSLQYNYMTSRSDEFESIMEENPYIQVTMQDLFIPRMRYTYIYSSPKSYRHPIWLQLNVSEASNLLSLGYMAAGKKWNHKDKEMFKNPYAQFVKIDAEFRKTWRVAEKSELVGHVGIGAIWSYGNSTIAPYSEQFYVGGANSIRAFTVRSIGPGAYHTDSPTGSYLDQTGDLKFLANLEYRPQLIGNLYGAIFLDMGNVWTMRSYDERPEGQLKLKNLLKEMAVGTGIGLRYDLGFFVIRADWGIGLHLPYKKGWYNISNFKEAQSFHLAVGYPF